MAVSKLVIGNTEVPSTNQKVYVKEYDYQFK